MPGDLGAVAQAPAVSPQPRGSDDAQIGNQTITTPQNAADDTPPTATQDTTQRTDSDAAQQLAQQVLQQVDTAIRSSAGKSAEASALLQSYLKNDGTLDQFERAHVAQVLARDLRAQHPADYKNFIDAIAPPLHSIDLNLGLAELDKTPRQFSPALEDRHVAALAHRSIQQSYEQARARHSEASTRPQASTVGDTSTATTTGAPAVSNISTPQQPQQQPLSAERQQQALAVLVQVAQINPEALNAVIQQLTADGKTSQVAIDAVKSFLTSGGDEQRLARLPEAEQGPAAALLGALINLAARQPSETSQFQSSSPANSADRPATQDPISRPGAASDSRAAQQTQPTADESASGFIASSQHQDPPTVRITESQASALRQRLVEHPREGRDLIARVVSGVVRQLGLNRQAEHALLRAVDSFLLAGEMPASSELHELTSLVLAQVLGHLQRPAQLRHEQDGAAATQPASPPSPARAHYAPLAMMRV